MPKTAVDQWSETAGDNGDVGGIDLGEGTMQVSAVNGALREIMAQVATGIDAGSFVSYPTPVQISASVADIPIKGTNTTDSAGNTVLRLDSDRATPGDFDQADIKVYLSNDAGTQIEAYRATIQMDDVSAGTEDSSKYERIMVAGTLTPKTSLTNSGFFPYTDGGLSLGVAANMWSAGFFSGSITANVTLGGNFLAVRESASDAPPEFVGRKGRVGPAAAQADDRICALAGQGYDGTSYNTTNSAAITMYAAEEFTPSARGSYMIFGTTAAGTTTRSNRLYIQQGLYHGSATGGDKGNNTINFGAVYDDNSLLSCYPFEAYLDGEIDEAKWDGMVPDRYIPEVTDDAGKVVEPARIEPRFHEDMRKFKARLGTDTDPLDLDKYIAHWKEKRHLTSLPDENRFDPVKGLPSGAWIQRLVETVEIQAIHISQLHDRLKVLEAAAEKA